MPSILLFSIPNPGLFDCRIEIMSISEFSRCVPVATDPKRSKPIILELASASETSFSTISTCFKYMSLYFELIHKNKKWRLINIF